MQYFSLVVPMVSQTDLAGSASYMLKNVKGVQSNKRSVTVKADGSVFFLEPVLDPKSSVELNKVQYGT